MEKLYRSPEPRDDGRPVASAAASERIAGGLIMRPTVAETMSIGGTFHAQHLNADGKLLWEEDFDNVVTDVGKAALLDKVLGLQTAFSAIHMGLKDAGGSGALGDTMAQVAAGGTWSEIAATVVANRLVPTFAAATGTPNVDKATSAAVSFPIVTAVNVVIAGCFIVLGGTSAVLNTTGTLYSVGDFSASRTVNSGDTLNVSYTARLS